MAETPDYPIVALGGVTELRIHGVSGTPTTSMLRNPHPVQVWGDKTAGFYRSAHDHGAPPSTAPTLPDRTLEAYSWGGLTAGTKTRAAWLLLLPFMLLNVASWAHPRRQAKADGTYWPVGWMSGLLRTLALTLTLTFALVAAILGMDVLAWQCAGNDACAPSHWYTKHLGRIAHPGTRLAVGALVPILLLLLLSKLSKSTGKKYEQTYTGQTDGMPLPPDDAPWGVRDLGHPKFWMGGGPLSRLRSLHVTASVAGVAGLLAYASSVRDPSDWRGQGRALAGACLVLVTAVAVLLATPLTGRRHELLRGNDPSSLYRRVVAALRVAAFVLLGLAAAYAIWGSDRPWAAGPLPGTQVLRNALFASQAGLLIGLTLFTGIAVGMRDGTKDTVRGLMFKGLAEPFLAFFATLLAGAYAAGIALRVTDLVGNPTTTKCAPDCPRSPIYLPDEFFWAAFGFGVLVVLAVLGVGYLLLWRKPRLRKAAMPGVVAEYPGFTDEPRREAIATAHAAASLTDEAPGVLAFMLLGAALVTAVVWRAWPHALLGPWTTAGAWLVGAFAIGLVGIARSAYKNPSLRRTVGIAWDLGTFWPRAAHPFAPPCYCERTVPEFVTRIRQTKAGGGKVVVSAHSQGTVIAAAALLQLHAEEDGLALLTYGSPLQRFYARLFPHFFGDTVLLWLKDALDDRWINLYRRSDPIGQPVLRLDSDPSTARPDERVPDPSFATPPYAFDAPKTRGHSDYWDDPRFEVAVSTLAGEV